MPYLKAIDRERLLKGGPAFVPGDLNFIFSRACKDYIANHGPSYQAINDCIGALECAKLELYRRTAAPYEDKKILENGDV